MNALPSSIEAYLKEAGFSVTELLVLRNLLAEDALTVRQLASKTGKSTGPLDMAMKKLVRKNVIRKEWINDVHKYTLVSLDAVKQWLERDMCEKRAMLLRRHQDFESFVSSLSVDKVRPEMQHYEGLEGLQQAYLRLLEVAPPPPGRGKVTEMLHSFPVVCEMTEESLRDFRVQYFRERRSRGVFSRVIAHNTLLGRRYQSRDPFEYRKTVLVPEEQYPFTFEKVIVGDTVACFNHAEKRSCLLHYPELADAERALFEMVWQQKIEDARKGPASDTAAAETASAVPPLLLSPERLVSFPTRALSTLREFFCRNLRTPKSLRSSQTSANRMTS